MAVKNKRFTTTGIITEAISLVFAGILFYYNIFKLAVVGAHGYVAIGLPFIYQYRNGLSESTMVFFPIVLTFNIIAIAVIVLILFNIRDKGLRIFVILTLGFIFVLIRIAMMTYFEFICLGTSSMCNG